MTGGGKQSTAAIREFSYVNSDRRTKGAYCQIHVDVFKVEKDCEEDAGCEFVALDHAL